MLILKCTKKAQEHLGLTPAEIVTESTSYNSILGAWYVNQFMIDRRKTFIFMNERTYLSFILFGIKKSNTKKEVFPDMLLGGLVQLLKLQDTPIDLIEKVIEDCFEARYTNTDNRKILGNLNDLMGVYQHHIMSSGGLSHCDLSETILRINTMPQKNLGWKNSKETIRELLEITAT